jgi:hypothetical protein
MVIMTVVAQLIPVVAQLTCNPNQVQTQEIRQHAQTSVAILLIGSTSAVMAHHDHHHDSGGSGSSGGGSSDPGGQSVTCGIGQTFNEQDQKCEISASGILRDCVNNLPTCTTVAHIIGRCYIQKSMKREALS